MLCPAAWFHRVVMPRLASSSCPCGTRQLKNTVNRETLYDPTTDVDYLTGTAPDDVLDLSNAVCAATPNPCSTCMSGYWCTERRVTSTRQYRLVSAGSYDGHGDTMNVKKKQGCLLLYGK